MFADSFRPGVIAVALVGLLAIEWADAAPGIRWEPYTYDTRAGEPVTDGELGRITVPERHDAPDRPTVELAFVRFRSTAANPAAPIVWLFRPARHGLFASAPGLPGERDRAAARPAVRRRARAGELPRRLGDVLPHGLRVRSHARTAGAHRARGRIVDHRFLELSAPGHLRGVAACGPRRRFPLAGPL